MVCGQIHSSTAENRIQNSPIIGGGPALEGSQILEGNKTDAGKRVKKAPKPKVKSDPLTPIYKLEVGGRYNVSDHHKSVRSAEYTGYETIGRLILYCFMQDTQPYKFSEVALIQSGKIRKAGEGAREPQEESQNLVAVL